MTATPQCQSFAHERRKVVGELPLRRSVSQFRLGHVWSLYQTRQRGLTATATPLECTQGYVLYTETTACAKIPEVLEVTD